MMNIGIVLGHQTADYGGGYTFQEEVSKSLIELADECSHAFYLFCDSRYAASHGSRIAKKKNLIILPFRTENRLHRLLSKFRREFSLFRKARKIFSASTHLEKVAREHDIKLVWFLSPWAEFIDIPYITIVWDLQHRLQPWFPEISINGEWDSREDSFSWFLQRASLVIAGTETGKAEIERFYRLPADRIKILPHPTPKFAINRTDAGNIDVYNKYDLKKDYLLYPAQFWPHKNHANLIRAIRILRDDHKLNFTLVLIGTDKGNQSYIKKLTSALNIEDQIRFLGFIPRQDLVALYKNALALTYVTFFGPENLPPLEAFALGCPVIASDVSGSDEQLGDAALRVDPKSPRQIAGAIKEINENLDLRNTLILRGKIRARKWTSDDFVRGMFPFFDEFESIARCWSG